MTRRVYGVVTRLPVTVAQPVTGQARLLFSTPQAASHERADKPQPSDVIDWRDEVGVLDDGVPAENDADWLAH